MGKYFFAAQNCTSGTVDDMAVLFHNILCGVCLCGAIFPEVREVCQRGRGRLLENKLGILNAAELARTEEQLSKKCALEMFETGFLDSLQPGTFASLSVIHRYLFGDIYAFAGEMRTVNIAKGNFRFAPVMYLREAVSSIERMPQSDFEQIVEKYVEMNVAHPFREGNGRSMRIWLDVILKAEIGRVVDWSRVDKEEYLLAMERSPVRDIEIKHLLQNALTDKIDDRAVYMKGIDYSYYYEGYAEYRTEDL